MNKRAWTCCLVAQTLVCLSINSPSSEAQSFVKGRIEENDLPTRVGRPAPASKSAKKTGKYTAGSASADHEGKAKLDLNIDDFTFSPLSGKTARSPKTGKEEKETGILEDDDEKSRALVIAWEAWHKRLAHAIYARWIVFGGVPGEAKVKVTVSKDGDVECSVSDFHPPGYMEYEPGQEQEFKHTVDESVRPLAHRPFLRFPEKSKRVEVVFDTKFAAQMDYGESGYTWKKGDYEKVTE